MFLKKEELKSMLEQKGRKYVLTMYINRFFDLTDKQLNYVLELKEEKNNGK